jgi:hypothetical protein
MARPSRSNRIDHSAGAAQEKTAALDPRGGFKNSWFASFNEDICCSNSKRSEDDGTEKCEGSHHCQHVKFQRQTHGITSEHPTTDEVSRKPRRLQKENIAAPRQISKQLI